MKKGLYFLIFIIFIFPKTVLAEDTFSVSLSCPEVVTSSQTITCNVNISETNFTINKINGNFTYSDGISSTSSLSLDNISVSSSSQISTLNIEIPSDAQSNHIYTITLNSIVANDTINASSAQTSFRVASNDNTLKEVNATGMTINYNSESQIYTGITENASTVLSATLNDEKARITSGTGEKSLNYGNNSFIIEVFSESNKKKEYTVIITRRDNRDDNNYLKSLIVTNTDLNFERGKTEYNLSTTSSQVTISPAKEATKAYILGDTGKKTLNYGLNRFEIRVVAENNATRLYVINITRVDNRSNNNYLKSLTISNATFSFNKTTTLYNITVNKDIEKVKINATLDDSKASFDNGFGSREVQLTLGNNTVYIKVKNEKGELRVYTLNINRDDGRDSDATLKSLKTNVGDLDFKPDVLDYKINVEYKVQRIKIDAISNKESSKVTIEGDTYLKVGKNVFKIIVEAQNTAKTTYTIVVNRKEEGYELSSDNYIKNLKIKGYNLNFNKNTTNYEIETRLKKLPLTIKLSSKESKYKIIGNDNLKEGSKVRIRVTAENGDIRENILTIKKPNNTMIISLIVVTTLTALALVWLVIKKIKQNKNPKSEEDIELLDEDFIKTK